MCPEANTLDQVEIAPTGGALGAEVKGLDLALPLQEDVVAAVRQAVLDHCVVFFRRQTLSDDDQLRFTSYFAPGRRRRSRKEILTVSNIVEDGKPIGHLGNQELPFHSELAFMRYPPTLQTLYALEIPDTGGATHWTNCYTAYEALDDGIKAHLKGLRAVHRHPREILNPSEPVDHPVVRVHPETGRRSLYISPLFAKFIVGLDVEESQGLLDKLKAQVLHPDFMWTHTWQVGDFVLWDNRSTIHCREAFPSRERRHLKRIYVSSEIPSG